MQRNMAEQELQQQIGELNRKMDLLLESIELQNRKREEIDDLFEDVSIVAKDAFRETVAVLDAAQIEPGQIGFSNLAIRILQNMDTLHDMLEMMESIRDFMKDASPVLHQVGLDAVHKMNELDRKGYFEFGRQLMVTMDRFVEQFSPGDFKRLQEGMTAFTEIIRNLTDPEVMQGMQKITRALGEVKPDASLDNVSLLKLVRMLNAPGVRRSLSYSLRLLNAVGKQD
jgi:uncharacterized protein YjgD (DUF1641 family)